MRVILTRGAPRALLVLTIAAAALTAWTIPALAEGEVVTITPERGDPVQVQLADVEGDIRTTYLLRFPGGREERKEVVDGVTVRDLVAEAGLEDYDYVEIERPADHPGTPVRLSAAQLEGDLPPAVYIAENGVMRFIRQSQGPRDVNGHDWIAFDDGSMSIAETSRVGLDVTVEASKRRIDAGESIRFSATVEGGGVGDEYEYGWAVNRKGRAIRRVKSEEGRLTHEFAKPGSYFVDVVVRSAVDNGGGVVGVRVGRVKDEQGEAGGGGSGQSGDTGGSSGDTGNSGGTGGTYDYSDSYDSGSDYSYDSGSAYDYDSGSNYDYDSGSTYDYESTYSEPPGGPLDRQQQRSQPGLASDDGTVEGYLLADVSTPPSPAASDAARAARAGFVADDEGGSVPPAVWALLGTLVLMTLGATLERRPSRPRLSIARVPRVRGASLKSLLRRSPGA